MQYILVHGAWQGGWCWEFLASELQRLSGKTKHKMTYILCEDDRDVHITTQQSVLQNFPVKQCLKSGHFPFLSHLHKLADIIEEPSCSFAEF